MPHLSLATYSKDTKTEECNAVFVETLENIALSILSKKIGQL
jgi:hypothetical protein